MFRYFGRKVRIAHLYPRPRFGHIIEPFAGAASYALHAENWTREVTLVEINPDIAELWEWLIHPSTTAETFAKIPKPEVGQAMDWNGNMADRFIMMGAVGDGSKYQVTTWVEYAFRAQIANAIENIDKVKHWKIIQGDYREAPNVEASWFVDPPYQFVESGYAGTRASIDFASLGDWCRSRRGQVIACDNLAATWLDFKPLTSKATTQRSTVEAVWLSEPDPGRLFDLASEGATAP